MAAGRPRRRVLEMTRPAPLCATQTTLNLVSEVRLTSHERIEGYTFDPNRLDARFVVELLIDGQPAALARADLYDVRLRACGVGDGCYRFAFAISNPMAEPSSSFEVRIANTNQLLGSASAIDTVAKETGAHRGPGEVQWTGGL